MASCPSVSSPWTFQSGGQAKYRSQGIQWHRNEGPNSQRLGQDLASFAGRRALCDENLQVTRMVVALSGSCCENLAARVSLWQTKQHFGAVAKHSLGQVNAVANGRILWRGGHGAGFMALASDSPTAVGSLSLRENCSRSSNWRSQCVGRQRQVWRQCPASFVKTKDGPGVSCMASPSSSSSHSSGEGLVSEPGSSALSYGDVRVSMEEPAEERAQGNANGEPTGRASAQVDLELPRRRYQVAFTCNVCTVRTKRLVNPDAVRRGTVFVQCSGCDVWHQLVDNLGLIVEYDFRKEVEVEEIGE